MEVVMLERYFVRPDTIDRLRASWIAEPLERYVTWLTEEGYAARTILRRVPIVVCFGEFAQARGATTWADLVDYVEPFGEFWLHEHGHSYPTPFLCQKAGDAARHPVWQMLRLVVPGSQGLGRRCRLQDPFAAQAPGFFRYLREERGLRETSIGHYGHYLRALEKYLRGIGLAHLHELSPPVLSAFIMERRRCGSINSRSALQGFCSALRVFIRYLYREGLIARDLSGTIEGPQFYRLAILSSGRHSPIDFLG
jgi:site-specific recombinase XerD